MLSLNKNKIKTRARPCCFYASGDTSYCPIPDDTSYCPNWDDTSYCPNPDDTSFCPNVVITCFQGKLVIPTPYTIHLRFQFVLAVRRGGRPEHLRFQLVVAARSLSFVCESVKTAWILLIPTKENLITCEKTSTLYHSDTYHIYPH